MKNLNIVLATLAAVFLLVSGGEALYILDVHRDSAAWQQRVVADSVSRNALVDSLAHIGMEVAARDSIIATERAGRIPQQKAIARAKPFVDAALILARDSMRQDSVRLQAYEVAIASLGVELVAKTNIIASQDREIAQLEAKNLRLEDAAGLSLTRIAELEALVAAAPAVQAPKRSGNVFKVVGGFLAGVGAGAITALLIGAK